MRCIKMCKVTKLTELQGGRAIEYLGVNLLEGIEPEVVSENGGHPDYKNWSNQPDPTAYKLLTAPYSGDLDEHIDIFSENFTMTFDLEKTVDIDGLFTSGFWFNGNNGIYMLGKYELHVAEEKTDMYTEKSLVAAVDNTEISTPQTPRLSEAYFKCEGLRGRYVGFKMLKANATDDITRMAFIGAYSDAITEQKGYLKNIIENNYLTADLIELPEGSRGCPCTLVNGSVFDVADAVVLSRGEVILCSDTPAEYLIVAGLIEGITVYTADSRDTLWISPAAGELKVCDTKGHDESCYLYKFDSAKKYIGIKLNDGAVLEQLGLYTYLRHADVDVDNIKTKDIVGIGANDIPMARMPESRQEGFRNVYWPVYCHRMNKAQPSTVRVWFQVDWVVTNEEDYLGGICNFKSDKMRQFLPYMDAYEAAGIDVELNFGWKASTEIYEWFSFASAGAHKMGGQGKSASAPRNFEGFAKCCAATVKYLAEEKGYTCLKHLTFYNESNYGDNTDHMASDFCGYMGKSKEMWEKMLRLVDKELKAIGADKYVDYWLAEESGTAEIELQWIDYMMKNCREFNALNTFHRYRMKYDTRLEYFKQVVEHAGEVGAAASEFAVYTPPTWNQSNIEYVMSMLHGGLRGGLYWCLQGVKMTDPTWLSLGCKRNAAESRGFWWLPAYQDGDAWTENPSFYDFCLFTRYMPRHSKVLETYSPDEDTRIETIMTPDGNYTVFVESNVSKFNKTIEVKFSKAIGKTFYKHVHKESEIKLDGNLTVPPVVKEIEVGDTLTDTIDGDYQLVCYTTLPAVKQLKFNSAKAIVPLGESFKFEAETIDCEGEIVWEVVASDGVPCLISDDGVVSAAELTRSRDVHCIKASLKDNPDVCGFAIVKFE